MSSLKIDCQSEEGLLLVRLDGRLDGNSAPELGRIFREQLEAGVAKVVCDLHELSFISSAGLREFMVLAQKLHRMKTKGVLVGVQPRVAEVLEISGMIALFQTAATLDEGRRLAAGKDAGAGFFRRLFPGTKP